MRGLRRNIEHWLRTIAIFSSSRFVELLNERLSGLRSLNHSSRTHKIVNIVSSSEFRTNADKFSIRTFLLKDLRTSSKYCAFLELETYMSMMLVHSELRCFFSLRHICIVILWNCDSCARTRTKSVSGKRV